MENKKKYDRDFKVNTVLLSYKRKSITKLANELGLNLRTLALWRQEYKKFGSGSFPGTGNLLLRDDQKKIYELEKKIKLSDLKFEILKNAGKYLSQGRPMIFQFMKNNEYRYTIQQMCKVLGVGSTTYRQWKNQFVSETKSQRLLLYEEITNIFFASKQRYGYMRIAVVLQNRGHKISSSTVGLYMRRLKLRCIITKQQN